MIGRPNVGKSTLVNRLVGARGSIVGEEPGLTRDRLEAEVEWAGRMFVLEDTGGLLADLLTSDSSAVTAAVAAKALEAARSADVVLFVVDTQAGITSDDLSLAQMLQRESFPVLVVANKADDAAGEAAAAEFWQLGLGEPVPVSGLHGRGSGELLDAVIALLPAEPAREEAALVPSVAIVGRPNVGKSSLFNRLVGAQRAIVHEEPGTTRDTVSSLVELDGRTYRFVDTAGIRRRSKTAGVEIYSASRTRTAIDAADVAVLVIDAAEGVTAQDQRIARTVAEAGAGAVTVLNKWDLVDDATVVDTTVADRLHFVHYAPLIRTSAATGRGIGRLIPQVDAVLAGRGIRIPTATLNELFRGIQDRHPAPSGARPARVLYATQISSEPPTFVLFSTARLAPAWLRFVERRLREEYGFTGNPIRLIVRERGRTPRTAGRGRQGTR
ncbi:MAG: ribosome biogenesis GTPase Der [Actinomycetota bacterium]